MSKKIEKKYCLPEYVLFCLNVLCDAGKQAYVVGGAVRDFALDLTPSDFDICTDALPEEIIVLFMEMAADRRIYVHPTGLKHGTVTVTVDGIPIEITTFRLDGEYKDNRRPENVYFSKSLEEDVGRRDFTVNGLAMDQTGKIFDFVEGLVDIQENCLIRAIGDPDKRFQEDALRILRALRFAACLGFKIENNTEAAIFRNSKLLLNIAQERIYAEMTKLLCGKYPAGILLQYAEIIGVVIPEILPSVGFERHNPNHVFNVWEHTVHVVKHVKPSKELRWAAFNHDLGKPYTYCMDESGISHFYGHEEKSEEISRRILSRLRADRVMQINVEQLVKYHGIELRADVKMLRKKLSRFGSDFLFDLILLKKADAAAQSKKATRRIDELENIEEILKKMIAEEGVISLKTLAVSGTDLIAIGGREGSAIGEILHWALNQVLEEQIQNDKLKLLKAIEEEFSDRFS